MPIEISYLFVRAETPAGFLSTNTPAVDALNCVTQFVATCGWTLVGHSGDGDEFSATIRSPENPNVEHAQVTWNALLSRHGVRTAKATLHR